MSRVYLDDMALSHRFGHFHLRMRSRDWRVDVQTDHNLGRILSAFSAAMKDLQAHRAGELEPRQTELRSGSMEVDTWTIAECWVAPYWWTMTMTVGRYSYTVRMDRDVEHVVWAFQGALKFFAFKCGLTTLDVETVRNRDRAGEAGLLTPEDFHA